MTPSQERRKRTEAAIIADYGANLPITEIMERNGVGRMTVFNILRRHNIEFRRPRTDGPDNGI